MSDGENEIRVNFGRPMPLFPLPSVALMPHAVLPLHVFEERYRRMVADALDGPGQIAMAVYAREEGRPSAENPRPPLRRAVCVGQMVQHHKLPDGRYMIALHGVCRARLLSELPEEDDVPYRSAMLEPVGIDEPDPADFAPVRARLADMLAQAPLSGLTEAGAVSRHLRDDDLPATAVLELVAVALLRDSDMRSYNELHYQLLAEGDAGARARLIEAALGDLAKLLDRARPQTTTDAPKGCSWN